MNWEAVGAIGEIVGAIAVVATLYYLALQIRENTARTRQVEANTNFQQVSPARLALAQSEQLAKVLAKGLEDLALLEPSEQIQFDALMSERFWITWYTWQRKQQGLIRKSMWDELKQASTIQMLLTPGGAAWFETAKGQFTKSFREEMERFIESEGDC